MEYLLESLNIEIEDLKEYDLNKPIEVIKNDLSVNKKVKSPSAIFNDALMFSRLGDRDTDINPLDPVFCTWDYTLFSARKKYFEYFTNCTQWFLFTPSRLMDHFAMMNFSAKPGSVSNEVLSLLDQDFSFQQQTQSLLDSILVIINPKNQVGLKYTNKLGELRQKEIIEIERKFENVQDSYSEENSVDIILKAILVYFLMTDSTSKKAFKDIFTKERFVDEFVQIIADEKEYVKLHGKSSDILITKMKEIIRKSESEEEAIV